MKRILIVDDDDHLRQVLVAVLSQNGYEVDGVPDGHAALARLDAHPYDLIVSDLTMPGLDGPALYEALRVRHLVPPRSTTTPPKVVFMTGNAPGHAGFLQRTTEPIIEKPFDLKIIRKVIRVLLDESRSPGAAAGKAAADKPQAAGSAAQGASAPPSSVTEPVERQRLAVP